MVPPIKFPVFLLVSFITLLIWIIPTPHCSIMRWKLQLLNTAPPVLLQQRNFSNMHHTCIIFFCLILNWLQDQWLRHQHLQLHHLLQNNQQTQSTQLFLFMFYPFTALTTTFTRHLHLLSLPQNLKKQTFHRWPAQPTQKTVVNTILFTTPTPSTSFFTLWCHRLWPPPPQVLQPLARLGPLRWFPISSVWWRIWQSSCLLLILDLLRSEVSACICVGKKFGSILFLLLPVPLLKTLIPPGTRLHKIPATYCNVELAQLVVKVDFTLN